MPHFSLADPTPAVNAGVNRSSRSATDALVSDAPVGLIARPVRSLLRREPVTIVPSASIRDAAALMRAQRVSSVLLVEDGRLVGIVTDRDLRNRAIAAGLDTDRPVRDVATSAPLTVDVRATAFDALLLMARQNVHHVPVMDGGRILGVIAATDLAERHSSSVVFLVGEILKQASIADLQRVTARVGLLQRSLASANASAYATGQVMTAVADASTTRLLQMAEARLGAPPVDYAWVAAGSQARSEQTAKSDQDNCLVLSNDYDAARHGEYFAELARFVCGGLDACGYVYCPGEMMAMTDTWRQPQHRWRQYFDGWVLTPEPKALMLTSVFFDLRAVHGRGALVDDLRREVLEMTRGNALFLAHMAANALSRRPPLGLFHRLVPTRSGLHRGTVDLKHLGIVPIVDLARVYALAAGHAAVNTQHRLESVAQSHEVSEQSARDLRDALEFLSAMRIRHQTRRIDAGLPADNFLDPRELSNFERTQLKDAFAVVQALQAVLEQRYGAALWLRR